MQMRQTPDERPREGASPAPVVGDVRAGASPAPAVHHQLTASSDRHRRGNGTPAPANRKRRGLSSRPVSHQGMQRRVPAERGISAYQHEHTTSQRNEVVVRRPLRTVPLVPLEGASGIPQRKESAQAVWSYVGDTEDIMPVAPTAPSFSTELDEATNVDGFIQRQAPLDYATTGVHQPAYRDTGATWPTYADEDEDEPHYRRAYGSISPARSQRNPNTDETINADHYGRSDRVPRSPARTDALRARTDALVGGGTGALAAEAMYLPTTTPLGSPYDHQHPASTLRHKRDTIFLALLTLLVLSIIGIMSCNYLLSMYNL